MLIFLNCTSPFSKALFLSRLSRREEAIESVLLSIAGVRWNWSAWLLLASCIGDGEEVFIHFAFQSIATDLPFAQLSSLHHLIPLPIDHPLIQLFQIKTLNDLHNSSEQEIQVCDRLLGSDFFPNSLFIMGLKACALYHMHGEYGHYLIAMHNSALIDRILKGRS